MAFQYNEKQMERDISFQASFGIQQQTHILRLYKYVPNADAHSYMDKEKSQNISLYKRQRNNITSFLLKVKLVKLLIK